MLHVLFDVDAVNSQLQLAGQTAAANHADLYNRYPRSVLGRALTEELGAQRRESSDAAVVWKPRIRYGDERAS